MKFIAHSSQVHLFLVLSHPFSHEDINGPILTQITIFSAQQLSKLTKLWLLLFDTTLNRNTFCYYTSPALKYRCFLVVNFKRLTIKTIKSYIFIKHKVLQQTTLKLQFSLETNKIKNIIWLT